MAAAARSGGASTGRVIYSSPSRGMLGVIDHAGGTESAWPALGIQRE